MNARLFVAGALAVPGGEAWRGGAALTIPGAHPIRPPPLEDVVAFPLERSGRVRLKVAVQAPRAGDSVWLVAQVLQGAPPTQRLHHAVVVHAGDDALQYRFDNPALGIQATSDAPVVNAAGEVVAVNLAGGLINGAFTAVGDSLASLRSALASAR